MVFILFNLAEKYIIETMTANLKKTTTFSILLLFIYDTQSSF